MDFDKFKKIIANLGDVWGEQKHLVFSRTRAFFTARYMPDNASEASAIIFCPLTGIWRYEGPHTGNIQQY